MFSFGVLAWEVFALAELPYATLSNEEVHERVVEGFRLSRPPRCPPELYGGETEYRSDASYLTLCFSPLPCLKSVRKRPVYFCMG